MADRATVLLGCYRKGDANDPEVYTSAVIAVLARYPEEVVMAVTEPATGLPSRLKWLPAISELVEACEAAYAPIRRQIEREKVAFDRVRLLAPEALRHAATAALLITGLTCAILAVLAAVTRVLA